MRPLVAIFDVSSPTLIILGVLAVLLFGERLPEVARSIGKGFMEFKKGVRHIQDDVEDAIRSAASPDAPAAPKASPPHYEEPDERVEATGPKFEPPP